MVKVAPPQPETGPVFGRRTFVLGMAAGLLMGMVLGAVLISLVGTGEIRLPQKDKSPYKVLAVTALPGWGEDDHEKALAAFARSCEKWRTLPQDAPLSSVHTMTPADWQEVCENLPEPGSGQAKPYFEKNFTALSLVNNHNGDIETGLFTGYFAPVYEGARTRSETYAYPLYMLPPDLQVVDLGEFDPRFKGHTIVGEVREGRFVPYKSRRMIEERRALDNQGLELVWLKNSTDAFFLHIQGSGLIRFPDGEIMQVGYAGKNGRPYRAVGRFLIENGEIPPENMSMQAIRTWMKENKDRATELMWQNPSYVFFRELDGAGPVGSLGVPLTPGRSLAVDRSQVPLGVPLWLDVAIRDDLLGGVPLKRLMVAQDTGGAIRGRVRGDIYWGIGAEAGEIAGHMRETGSYYLLLPHALAQKVMAETASSAARES
ncbi:murein transglycosylase A [Luteithermobacter gelatinilyticus]|uniref:murein transglycosylase A n=1 Tax=Luteithermobacter gelatinilyticus TaxID=2582913 RepID=UPI001106E7BB|nr:MltA domain-containing protein [Luteithermobacter gelatinilyticus]